ncbi:hypothetical protein [Photobacterium rosenbergii]|uniref:hypothetical protein n=1 Tax=Photobacterium rosenbergii TaxID=294936 RepID=UPI001C99871D|nr:hypothetical protein [Photobacterium rosenbergii]MBY5946241.1 hypothetical protein [Photobacterium rosenbergii]
MSIDEKLTEIEKEFSGKQDKLFKRINPLVGRSVSIGLISLQGVERTSQAEIEVIANLISQFNPLKVVDFQRNPRRVTFLGTASAGYSVHIIPQYKVRNVNSKAQDWAIDLVLELHKHIGSDVIRIDSIGVEYDGYPSHYVESKVKQTYQRDIGIVSKEGILSIRISPESWKKDPCYIKNSIKEYFDSRKKIIEDVQKSTINAYERSGFSNDDSDLPTYTTCPICNGRGQLAGENCPVCDGMGDVKGHEAELLDISEYDNFTCPRCEGSNLDCAFCNGSGKISREKALES